jgi:hypothetical protein
MTTLRQWRANRMNSRSSTGPRSNEGKARSAYDARRHGLSIPIAADPQLGAEAEALAQELARGHTIPHAIELSREIAEAQIDLYRARQVRRALLQHGLAGAVPPAGAPVRPRSQYLENDPISDHLPATYAQIIARALVDLCSKVHAIQRYESRALARRKFAIRAFNSALKGHEGSPAKHVNKRHKRLGRDRG